MHSPRASHSPETAHDIRQNRSATPGPIAPRGMKFRVRHRCHNTDRVAARPGSASRAAEARVEHPKFPAPWPAACASSTPALDLPNDRFAVINSPARRFLAAIMPQLAPHCSFIPNLWETPGGPKPLNYYPIRGMVDDGPRNRRSVVNTEKRCQPKNPVILKVDTLETL